MSEPTVEMCRYMVEYFYRLLGEAIANYKSAISLAERPPVTSTSSTRPAAATVSADRTGRKAPTTKLKAGDTIDPNGKYTLPEVAALVGRGYQTVMVDARKEIHLKPLTERNGRSRLYRGIDVLAYKTFHNSGEDGSPLTGE